MSRGRWAVADESDEDKTESPSPRRLEKAREEGQVPQSRELSTFVVLMAGGAALWALSQTMGRQMAQIEVWDCEIELVSIPRSPECKACVEGRFEFID